MNYTTHTKSRRTNKIEHIHYNGETGAVENKSLFSDFVNHRHKIEKYYGGISNENALRLIFQNSYDQEGNHIEMIVLDENENKQTSHEYKWDSKGNIISTKSFSYKDQNESYEEKAVFDEKGNLIEDLHKPFGKGEVRTTYEYEFDNVGNWIKRNIKGEANTIAERIITYYE